MRSATVLLSVIGLSSVSCASGPPPGHIASAELGDKWPLTVEEGLLECTKFPSGGLSTVPMAVTFKAPDGRVFAVNGTAKGRGHAPIDAIWKTAPLSLDAKPLERLPEQERRAIFSESVACEDEADRKATAKYSDPNDFKRQIAFQEQLSAACKTALRKRHKLSEDDEASISVEGVSLSWPPLTPTRVNIGPLIERGLKLCDS